MTSRSPRCVLASALAALALAGCGSVVLNRTFNDYSEVYADTQNRQLLLNLARMANTHPPHFLQLGLINATFSFGSTATANVTNTETQGVSPTTASPPFRLLSRVWSWVFGATASFTETPTFSMTPLAGPQFAQGFLAGVPATVFFRLLEQGEPIDQLLRVLVHAVEFTFPGDDRPVVIENTPDPDRPASWVEFLRLAGILLELQQRRLLLVATTVTPTPAAPPYFEAPTLEQALKVAEKGMALREVSPGKFALTASIPSTSLRIDEEASAVFAEMGRHPYYRLESLARPGMKEAPKHMGLTLKLRSFFSVMSWMSYEQKVYDTLARRPGFLDSLPPAERRPVLKLTWEDTERGATEPPLMAVKYLGERYAITDRRGETWNRDIFTLLSYIESQVALDPKNLPVQQLINVR